MPFADFLRARMARGNPPPPVGPFPGDRRLDAVEQQRGSVYPLRAAPGYVCFEDGSCLPAAEYERRTRGGRTVAPQPTGRPAAMPGAGDAFAAFLASRMARGGGSVPVPAYPSPSPSMAPGNVVCDENGEHCRPVSRR